MGVTFAILTVAGGERRIGLIKLADRTQLSTNVEDDINFLHDIKTQCNMNNFSISSRTSKPKKRQLHIHNDFSDLLLIHG